MWRKNGSEKMKSPVTRREAAIEIAELNEIIEGAQIQEKVLRDYLFEICDLIYMQQPLDYQDRFVEIMIELGLYKPEIDE
jgi:hypothetical protein